jgi:hypothetical protein
MLTTVDNPFDPFEQFTSWLLFDKERKHNCCEVLDRIVEVSDDMTQKEIDEETERAIDELIKHDPLNLFKKVKKELNVVEDEDIDLEEDIEEE